MVQRFLAFMERTDLDYFGLENQEVVQDKERFKRFLAFMERTDCDYFGLENQEVVQDEEEVIQDEEEVIRSCSSCMRSIYCSLSHYLLKCQNDISH